MLKLTAIGNVGKDAEIRTTNTGSKAISFTICHNESWTNAQGLKETKSVWINCTLWRDKEQGTKIAEFIKAGSKVYVEGTPSASAYSNKNGQLAASLELNVKMVELLDKKPQDAGNTQGQPQDSNTPSQSLADPATYEQVDDLPF